MRVEEECGRCGNRVRAVATVRLCPGCYDELLRALDVATALRVREQRAAPADRLLTPREAAALLKVQPATLRGWVGNGKLRGYDLHPGSGPNGRRLRVRYSEVVKLLAPAGAD